tara:strand:+ start:5475 stop:5783 length:309 start_codon:yes stop_codon:yes gene_type:complete
MALTEKYCLGSNAMTGKEEDRRKIDNLLESFPEAMTMDGFDDCIIGVCQRFGQEEIITYSLDRVIKKLESQGMTYDEALEWYEFNMIGSWVGETTPCFVEEL